jgi:hypothetical protein
VLPSGDLSLVHQSVGAWICVLGQLCARRHAAALWWSRRARESKGLWSSEGQQWRKQRMMKMCGTAKGEKVEEEVAL